MSSIADRRAYRNVIAEAHTGSQTERWFWLGLLALGVIMIGAALAGAAYTQQVPHETYFVGP